jgi:hypothetical protein
MYGGDIADALPVAFAVSRGAGGALSQPPLP